MKVTTVFELVKKRAQDYTPEKASAISGVHPDNIRQVARTFGKAKPGDDLHGLPHVQVAAGRPAAAGVHAAAVPDGKPGQGGRRLPAGEPGQHRQPDRLHAGGRAAHAAGGDHGPLGLRPRGRQGTEREDLRQGGGRQGGPLLPGIHPLGCLARLRHDALEDGHFCRQQHRQLAVRRRPLAGDRLRQARDHRHDGARHGRHGHVLRLRAAHRPSLRAPGLHAGSPHALRAGSRRRGAAARRGRGRLARTQPPRRRNLASGPGVRGNCRRSRTASSASPCPRDFTPVPRPVHDGRPDEGHEGRHPVPDRQGSGRAEGVLRRDAQQGASCATATRSGWSTGRTRPTAR